MKIASTMYFRPPMRTARLFMPDLDKAEFFLQLRIAHDFVPQRSGPGRDYLNYGLHSRLASTGNDAFCNASLIPPVIKTEFCLAPKARIHFIARGSTAGFIKTEDTSAQSAISSFA